MFFLYASVVLGVSTLVALLINQPPLNNTFRSIALVVLGALFHRLYHQIINRLEQRRRDAEWAGAEAWQNGDYDGQGWGDALPQGQGWGNTNNAQDWQGWGNDTTKAGWEDPDKYDRDLLVAYLTKQMEKRRKELYESDEI